MNVIVSESNENAQAHSAWTWYAFLVRGQFLGTFPSSIIVKSIFNDVLNREEIQTAFIDALFIVLVQSR